jgi:AraC-like DNA-binding protein
MLPTTQYCRSNEMSVSPSDAATIQFSTDAFSARERLTAWRDTFGSQIAKLDIAPLREIPFYAHMNMRLMPGLVIASGSGAVKDVGRTRALVADGNESLVLHIASCAGRATQFGQDIPVAAGDAILLSNSHIGTFTFEREQSVLAIGLPRATLAPSLQDPDAAFTLTVSRDNEALRLLKAYAGTLERGPPVSEELQALAAAHVNDLVALALGATRDATEIARTRGIRAARLHLAKAHVTRHLGWAGLSPGSVAAHLGITPRYVHILFETSGMSFSEFVLARRLAHAHRMLTSPLHAGQTISAIAFAAGFADLSHFNRSFRRRYGCTPSDVRIARRRER